MTVVPSKRFGRSFRKAPKHIQDTFERKLQLLLAGLNHPSLHAKKFKESEGIWQARVNNDWRFYFTIEPDRYNLIDITPHPK